MHLLFRYSVLRFSNDVNIYLAENVGITSIINCRVPSNSFKNKTCFAAIIKIEEC